MPHGYLYILSNPTMPGLCKVGKTEREPALRAAELSGATGVPSPFVLLYQQPVTDVNAAETWVHEALSARGWRHADNREFFAAPLHEIVALVARAADVVNAADPSAPLVFAPTEKGNCPDSADELSAVYLMGMEIIYGVKGRLAEPRRGIKLVMQAADLGHLNARITAAELLMSGENRIRKDLSKAYAYLTTALEEGATECHALLAQVMLENGQRDRAEEHWKSYFAHTAYRLRETPSDDVIHQHAARDAGKYGRPIATCYINGRSATLLTTTLSVLSFRTSSFFIRRDASCLPVWTWCRMPGRAWKSRSIWKGTCSRSSEPVARRLLPAKRTATYMRLGGGGHSDILHSVSEKTASQIHRYIEMYGEMLVALLQELWGQQSAMDRGSPGRLIHPVIARKVSELMGR
ncbi:GIY-YIG nuclease family protein [Massilia niabensis]|uniref:GIY-YIG nuclease family protein n=1 Tax=Massilia niabensis TaxID=544910 RepID=A0ABW0L2Z3_9BURK